MAGWHSQILLPLCKCAVKIFPSLIAQLSIVGTRQHTIAFLTIVVDAWCHLICALTVLGGGREK